MMKNYLVDTMISVHFFFETYRPHHLLPLKRPDIEKDYDDTFLPLQTPTVEALITDFDRSITNLI